MGQAVRTFRIFVSSTFSDLREERNALHRDVFPCLKQLCAAHGTRFQAIDLRWGVSEEAGLDQRTMQICLDEIERCRRTSPQPNFVVLLGDRYGWRPLPAVIPAAEFERLLSHVASGDDVVLITAWYFRDDNATPPEYRLTPRRIDTPEGQTEEGREAARKAEAEAWNGKSGGMPGIEASLRRILTHAAARESLSRSERTKYTASATDQEIENGAVKVGNAREHVFCYFREIANVEELVRDLQEELPEDDRARNFIDVRDDGSPDADARDQLIRLKSLLENALPANTHRYQTLWTGRRGVSYEDAETRSALTVQALATALNAALANGQNNSQPGVAQLDNVAWTDLRRLKDEMLHKRVAELDTVPLTKRPGAHVITVDHLPMLCADVFLDLARIILTEIARLQERDAVEQETDDHDAFSQERARVFIGRARALGAIAEYVAGADARPLVLYGASGSGKSAVMARGISLVRAGLPHAAIVQRFIGATPGSSDIRTLLDGVCRQITRLYAGDETTIPTDYRDLVQEFPRRLAIATAARPLVVMFDALDQLSDADYARNLIWLPVSLPEHVRLLVSTLPGECLLALERKLPEESRVQLEPMPSAEASDLLTLWLQGVGRTLQEDQRREVLDNFARSAAGPGSVGQISSGGLPLYLKLAFEEARHWTSSGSHPRLSADVSGIIRDLFGRLSDDANHGAMMVSRSLAYLAAAKNGLSEDEVLDVLTLDDDVFKDFEERARHRPPERRLPVVVWSRLFFDLEPYLSERAADGASLLSFYHRQLREVVEQDYLSSQAKVARHRVLAKYFGARSLFEQEGKVPNIRKLSELPYQETYGELWDDLHKTLTDFDFLEAKCTHISVVTQGRGESARKIYGGVYELQEDYRRALEKFPNV